MKNVDLHLHTHYSDGKDSPAEVVAWAYENGITEMAITDHDNIGGILEGAREAQKCGIVFHRGVEFSTETEDKKELHILGYDFDTENKGIKNLCAVAAENRKKRNDRLFSLIKEKFEIADEELKPLKDTAFVGKPNIGRFLVGKGYFRDIDEVFEKVFSRPDFNKIKKEKIPVGEAIEAIKAAGGKAVLAHPGLIKGLGARESEEFYANFEMVLNFLLEKGLDGLECKYSKHSLVEEERFVSIAEKYDLLITKGSDYHGKD